jgi:hypothetical protein
MAAERNGIGAVGTMVNISKHHPKMRVTIKNTYRFDRVKFDLNFFKKEKKLWKKKKRKKLTIFKNTNHC